MEEADAASSPYVRCCSIKTRNDAIWSASDSTDRCAATPDPARLASRSMKNVDSEAVTNPRAARSPRRRRTTAAGRGRWRIGRAAGVGKRSNCSSEHVRCVFSDGLVGTAPLLVTDPGNSAVRFDSGCGAALGIGCGGPHCSAPFRSSRDGQPSMSVNPPNASDAKRKKRSPLGLMPQSCS